MVAGTAFEWRPIAPADAKSWSGLLGALQTADGGWVHLSVQELIENFGDPDTDFERGSVVVYDGSSLAGYGVLSSRLHADETHELEFAGGVHPAYRQLGVGSALFDWAEATAVPVHHARFSGRRLSLSTSCMSTNEHALTLNAAHGYQPARWFHAMVRVLSGGPLPHAPAPAGVRIVGFSPERTHDARLIRNDAFRDHWGADEQTVASWAHFVDLDSFRPQFSFLAYAGDAPLGVIISHEYSHPSDTGGNRELYVAVVATRREVRNQGIASALLARALSEASTAGFTTSLLEVDADSMTGAVGLYERAGFTTDHLTVTHIKGLPGSHPTEPPSPP